MPLIRAIQIDADTKIGIWRIAEAADYFNQVIPPETPVQHPRKRLQHLAARHLLTVLAPGFPIYDIRLGNAGKPYLPGHTFHFSLSHSGDMAAAIVSTGHRAGIDLEHIDDRAWRIRHRFLNAAELEACPRGRSQAYLTLCWCAKEAVYKWHGDGGISFREHIRLRPFMPGPAGQISGYLEQGASSCPFRLHYLLEDTFALAWTMTP